MTKKEIKKLDDIWKDKVKERAGFKCEFCDKQTTLNSHHIFSRSNRSVRWDLNNGICLCVNHHVFGPFSAHKAPLEFAEWMIAKRGQKWYDALKLKSHQVDKGTFEEKLTTLG